MLKLENILFTVGVHTVPSYRKQNISLSKMLFWLVFCKEICCLRGYSKICTILCQGKHEILSRKMVYPEEGNYLEYSICTSTI